LPVAELVRVLTVFRLVLAPLSRVMVQPASQPSNCRVKGLPSATSNWLLSSLGRAKAPAAKAETATKEYFMFASLQVKKSECRKR